MAKFITVDVWVREALDRIEEFCGDRPEDWFYCEVAENAVKDWTYEDGYTDWEAVEDEIFAHADIYMDFIRRSYPERIREGEE